MESGPQTMPGELGIQIVNTILAPLTGGDAGYARHAAEGIEAALPPGAGPADLARACVSLLGSLGGSRAAAAGVAHVDVSVVGHEGPLFLRDAVAAACRPLSSFRDATLLVTGLPRPAARSSRKSISREEWLAAIHAAVEGRFSPLTRLRVFVLG